MTGRTHQIRVHFSDAGFPLVGDKTYGGRRRTFSGLAGMGDLVLTCTGNLSRNRRVGLGLGLLSYGLIAMRNPLATLGLCAAGLTVIFAPI